jgi:hypothetical protein
MFIFFLMVVIKGVYRIMRGLSSGIGFDCFDPLVDVLAWWLMLLRLYSVRIRLKTVGCNRGCCLSRSGLGVFFRCPPAGTASLSKCNV